jgi:16S rRNA (guanine966-N2)-methyltransferase
MRSHLTPHELRIIGGRWRSRRLQFPDAPGLRPTPDRVRETLFNWLAPTISGARCLDLFAGSGALGLEALSRGAAEVVFVEQDRRVIKTLQDNIHALQVAADVHHSEALRWLAAQDDLGLQRFDIILLDPPFGRNLLTLACQHLVQNGWPPVSGRQVYLESERDWPLQLPKDWRVLREKYAGAVAYRLIQAVHTSSSVAAAI